MSHILVWQTLVNPSNIGVAAAIPATLVPTALTTKLMDGPKEPVTDGFLCFSISCSFDKLLLILKLLPPGLFAFKIIVV